MSGRGLRRLLIGIFVIAIALRLVLASRGALWGDEVFSLAMATGHSLEHPASLARPHLGDFIEPAGAVPAIQFRQYLSHEQPIESPYRVIRAVFLSDTSPPFYYLLLYGWTLAFGTGDFTLRLFSVVCSLACFPLLFAVGRQIGGIVTAFAACIFFTFSPLGLFYSTEGRMYSLLWLCVVGVMWISLVWQERGGSISIYLVWVLFSAAGLLTHYFFVFPWLAMTGWLFFQPHKLSRMYLSACLFFAVLLVAPWYAALPGSINNWHITQGWLSIRPRHFNRATASLELVTQFVSGRAIDLWFSRRVPQVLATLLFAILALSMLWRMRAHLSERGRMLIWLAFLAPIVVPVMVDLIKPTYLMAKPRYAVAALPAAYLLAGLGLNSVGRRTGLVLLLLILAAWMPNVLSIYRKRTPWLPMREIAQEASKNTGDSDLILVHSIPSGVLAIARYASGSASMAAWIGQLGNRKVPQSIESLVAGRSRVSFVKVHDVGEPSPEEDWLLAHAVVAGDKRYGIGQMIVFRPRLGERF